MTPDALIDVMVGAMSEHLKPLKVSVRAHPGKFTWVELTRITYNCPAAFISCLGWREAPEEVASRFPGGQAHKVRFIAGIVTRSNKDANSRNREARLIAQNMSLFLERQDWDEEFVLEAEGIRCEPLYVAAAEEDGQSMWLLDWWHTMSFDADSIAASMNDFLVAHGDHYAEPGAYTDAEGTDLVASSDTVNLPQE